MILLALRTYRDEAWLEACLRGVDASHWIAEPIAIQHESSLGVSWERRLFSGVIVDQARRGDTPPDWLGMIVGPSTPSVVEKAIQPLRYCYWWTTGPGDAALQQEQWLELEDLLSTGVKRGSIRTHPPTWWENLRYPMTGMFVPTLSESAITVLEATLSARRFRVAGALISRWRATGALPSDSSDPAFPSADLLKPTDALPATLYTRISPTRFRLDTDVKVPAGSLFDPTRITSRPMPADHRWSSGRWYSVELELSDTKKP